MLGFRARVLALSLLLVLAAILAAARNAIADNGLVDAVDSVTSRSATWTGRSTSTRTC
jgi:hypothetical protein